MAELGQARTMDELMAVQNQMTALSQVQSQIAQATGGRAAGR